MAFKISTFILSAILCFVVYTNNQKHELFQEELSKLKNQKPIEKIIYKETTCSDNSSFENFQELLDQQKIENEELKQKLLTTNKTVEELNKKLVDMSTDQAIELVNKLKTKITMLEDKVNNIQCNVSVNQPVDVKEKIKISELGYKGKFQLTLGVGYGTTGADIKQVGQVYQAIPKSGVVPALGVDYFYTNKATVGIELQNNSTTLLRFGYLFDFL